MRTRETDDRGGNSRLRAVVGGLFFVAGLSLNTVVLAAEPAAPLKAVTVAHWGSERILIYLPLYVALDGNFFRREGLDVHIQYSGNDDQVFATVASGAAQFGVGDPSFTAISREKGGKGRLIASLVTSLTNWGVAKKLSIANISEPSQLNGQRITSFPPPSTTYTVLSALKSENKLSKLTIVPVVFGGELAALEHGTADIAILLEPQTSLAESKGYRVIWSLAKLYGPFLLTGVSTTDDVIARNPGVIQSFVNGLQKAIEFIRSNRQGTVDFIASSFPNLPTATLDAAVGRLIRDNAVPTSAEIDMNAWRRTLQLRVAVGDLKSLDLGVEAVDDTFAKIAAGNLAPVQERTTPIEQKSSAPAENDCWTIFSRASDVFSTISLLLGWSAALTWWLNLRRYRTVFSKQEAKVVKIVGDEIKGRTNYAIEQTLLRKKVLDADRGITMNDMSTAFMKLNNSGFLKLSGDKYIGTVDMLTRELRLQKLINAGILNS